MKIRRFEQSDVDAIARLNDRLRDGGAHDVVYPEGKEQHTGGAIRQRLFVAADGSEIRGGVWLKEQTFRVRGQDVVCGWLKYPVAESLVDHQFSGVPGSLIIQCLREQPLLMALGLGGHSPPLARMLAKLGWPGLTVPMLVRPVRPARCLRELAPLRTTRVRRVLSDALALSGAAWLGLRMWDLVGLLRGKRVPPGYEAEEYERLGSWADATWARVRDDYAFLAARDAASVDTALPPTPDVHRLRIRRHGADVGWVYVVRHDFSTGTPDARFGRLTVGQIGDCLAASADAAGVAACAFEFLIASGVDVVFSNQLHPAWIAALRRLGFVAAPSNFAFYSSPRIGRFGIDWTRECHLNRGDCDGPIWYAGR